MCLRLATDLQVWSGLWDWTLSRGLSVGFCSEETHFPCQNWMYKVVWWVMDGHCLHLCQDASCSPTLGCVPQGWMIIPMETFCKVGMDAALSQQGLGQQAREKSILPPKFCVQRWEKPRRKAHLYRLCGFHWGRCYQMPHILIKSNMPWSFRPK